MPSKIALSAAEGIGQWDQRNIAHSQTPSIRIAAYAAIIDSELQELMEAVGPFANVYLNVLGLDESEKPVAEQIIDNLGHITMGDYRRIAKAYKEAKGE